MGGFMASIKVSDLKFSYNRSVVLNKLSFSLKEGKSLSIIGPIGSGKTTLLHILNNEYKYTGEVKVDGKLEVIYSDFILNRKTVKSELNFYKKLNKEDLKVLDEYFNISLLLNKSIDKLSLSDKTLIKVISVSVTKPDYIALDNILNNLVYKTKIILLNYLMEQGITLINVTSNMEDLLFTDYTLCLYKKIIAVYGKTMEVIKNEKVLKRIGFNLPFIYDLSIQLKLYGLIKKETVNEEKLVNEIWK